MGDDGLEPGQAAVELDDPRVLRPLDRRAHEVRGACLGARAGDDALEHADRDLDGLLEALGLPGGGHLLVPVGVEDGDGVADRGGAHVVDERGGQGHARVDRVDALDELAVHAGRDGLVPAAQRGAVRLPDEPEGRVRDAVGAHPRAAALVVVEVPRRRVGAPAHVDPRVGGLERGRVAGADDRQPGLAEAERRHREDVVGVEGAVVGGHLHARHGMTAAGRAWRGASSRVTTVEGVRYRSASVKLLIVPLLAGAFTGCGGDEDEETAYCVDEDNQVVDNRNCDDDRTSGGFFWLFGGFGAARIGQTLPSGGERIRASDKDALARRGGFGSRANSRGGVGRPVGSAGRSGGGFSGGG
jgi:hypothetical protein